MDSMTAGSKIQRNGAEAKGKGQGASRGNPEDLFPESSTQNPEPSSRAQAMSNDGSLKHFHKDPVSGRPNQWATELLGCIAPHP